MKLYQCACGMLSKTKSSASTSARQSGVMTATLPLAGLSVRRTVNVSPSQAVALVREDITNDRPLGRVYNIVQHPSIAPPFLDETTLVDCNGKTNIPPFQRVLNAFAIPYRVVHDADANNPTAAAENAAIAALLPVGPLHTIHQLRPDDHIPQTIAHAEGMDIARLDVAIDAEAKAVALTLSQVSASDVAHNLEHSLEVQLPFLQQSLASFNVVPLLVADRDPLHVSAVLERWWDADDALIVVSTDLSHFLDYAAARRHDGDTDAAIMAFKPQVIGPEEACGCHALNGLLALAGQRHASIERLALCNSGDTAGTRDRVVGYASYALH